MLYKILNWVEHFFCQSSDKIFFNFDFLNRYINITSKKTKVGRILLDNSVIEYCYHILKCLTFDWKKLITEDTAVNPD